MSDRATDQRTDRELHVEAFWDLVARAGRAPTRDGILEISHARPASPSLLKLLPGRAPRRGGLTLGRTASVKREAATRSIFDNPVNLSPE